MESHFQIIFIILAILIVLAFWFLAVKYFLHPLFFKPKLNSDETFEFLKKRNLVFIEKRELNKAEKKINPFNYNIGFSLKKMFSERNEYVIVAFSESQKEHNFFWLELNQWYFLFSKFLAEILTGEQILKKRNIIFKEITNNEVLAELENTYNSETVLITDKCPACENRVPDTNAECPNCGLNFVA